MTTLLQTLNEADILPVLCLIAILTLVGSKMAEVDTAVRQWGRRLAGLGFAAYSVYAGLAFHASDEDDWLHIVIRALLAGGLLMGLSWIVLSILCSVGRCLKGALPSPARAMVAAARRRRDDEHNWRMHEQQERRALQDADRQAREMHAAAQKADDSRRRGDARMRCLALYDRHGTTLADRFPRERLQEYFELYMSDTSSPEIVEERALTLTALINDWVEQDKSHQKKQFRSLEEIAAHFQGKRDEVPGLPYDSEMKDTLVTNINIEEENTIRRFLS